MKAKKLSGFMRAATWAFPVLALLICASILIKRQLNKPIQISIVFPTAEGIVAGKTQLKYRGVALGDVARIILQESGVKVIVDLDRHFRGYAVEGAKFWLVEPQIGLDGISGLSTIRDGTYITMKLGDPSNPESLAFSASPAQAEIDKDLSIYQITTSQLGSLNSGDPIYFRGLSVGRLLSVALNPSATFAIIKIGIHSKYAKLIRDNSVFWRKRAINADLGLFGSKINIGSLETLMKGGVEFATPPPAKPRAQFAHVFKLTEDPPKKYEEWATELNQ